MAQHQDFKKPTFELSMLLYDTRYRSTSFQVIALIFFFSLVWWLVNNTMSNLAISGKDIDFSFLVNESNYDINQKLLEYDSRSTHGRAAVLGVLNTLVLSAIGCVTATILGVFVGIARLSKKLDSCANNDCSYRDFQKCSSTVMDTSYNVDGGT